MSESQEARRVGQHRVAQALILRLNDLADQLESLAEVMFAPGIPYKPENSAEVMVLAFVTKQREHLCSIQTLLTAGLHRDALLIARTMLEGLGRLIWALRDTPERTDLWFWYGAILDWRQTLENTAKDLIPEPDDVAELKALVDKHGPTYFKPNLRARFEEAEKGGKAFEMPRDAKHDPWRNNWADANVDAMFDEIGGADWYDTIYRESSEWIHWGPRALGRARGPVKWTSEERAVWCANEFTQEDWSAAGSALHLGIIAFLDTLDLLDNVFGLGRTERLVELNVLLKTIEAESLGQEG